MQVKHGNNAGLHDDPNHTARAVDPSASGGRCKSSFVAPTVTTQLQRVNGGVKSCHWAAQKSATLGLGMTPATRRRPVSRALHLAGG